MSVYMTKAPRIGSLCSGVGMLDLAVMDALGGTVAWHAQYDPDDKHQYAARILDHRFPGVPNHGDITAIDWAAVEPVDILTAGFPCQPFSLAGKQNGYQDERWLWDDVLRAIRELSPTLVLLENVPGLFTAPGRQPDCICGWNLRWGRHLGHYLDDHAWADEVLADDGGRNGEASGIECAVGGIRRPAGWGDATEDWSRSDAALGIVWRRDAVPTDADDPFLAGEEGPGGAHPRDAEPELATFGQRPWDRMESRGLGRVGEGKAGDGGAEQAGDGRSGRGDCPACGRPMDDSGKRPIRRAMGDVLGDLTEVGFDATWCSLRASDVGAPHQRWRAFVLAWPADAPRSGLEARREGRAGGGAASVALGVGTPADAEGDGRHQGRTEPARILRGPDAALGGGHAAADTARIGTGEPANQALTVAGSRKTRPEPGDRGLPDRERERGQRHDQAAADSPHHGRQRDRDPRDRRPGPAHDNQNPDVDWGPYTAAIRRWERVMGPAPTPTEPGKNGLRLAPALPEWMMGLPSGWVTQVPGIPRNAQLHALGNGVVRQQGAAAVRILAERACIGGGH